MKVLEVTMELGGMKWKFAPSEGDLKEQMKEAIDFKPRYKCDVCGSFDIANNRLFGNTTDDGITYIKMLCSTKDCKGSSTLGTLKNNKGNFWHKYEAYEGKPTTPNRSSKDLSIEDYSA